MNITKIDKEACKIIRAELDTVIAAKLAELGLEGGLLNGRFDDSLVTFKCEVKLAGALSKRDKDLNDALYYFAEVESYDLEGVEPKDIIEAEYLINDEKYKLVGYNSRAKKYPLVIQRIRDGEKYQAESLIVKSHFHASFKGVSTWRQKVAS